MQQENQNESEEQRNTIEGLVQQQYSAQNTQDEVIFKPPPFNILLSRHCKSLLSMQFPQEHPLRPYSLQKENINNKIDISQHDQQQQLIKNSGKVLQSAGLIRYASSASSVQQHLIMPQLLFSRMQQAQSLYDCQREARNAFQSDSKMYKRSQVLEIVSVNNQYVVCLLENGRCSIHQKQTKQILFFNKSNAEYIRSIFHNRQNQSVIIVSVTSKDECNSLKCRSVSVDDISKAFTLQSDRLAEAARGSSSSTATVEDVLQDVLKATKKVLKGTKLFKDFCLRWPDFIEFDELNAKIITKHSTEDAYRIWSLATYQLQYVLKDDKIAEFKICHGVMLLLYNIEQSCVPMALINVHSGQVIKRFSFDQTGKDIEFLEQFNERIMIKTKGNPLKIFNSWDRTTKEIASFRAPEAFIFLYEREKFLTLKEGKIEIWTSDGSLLTDFGGKILCTRVDLSGNADYIVSVSQSKRYLFAYQICKDPSSKFENQNATMNVINVIDIQKEQIIAQIRVSQRAYRGKNGNSSGTILNHLRQASCSQENQAISNSSQTTGQTRNLTPSIMQHNSQAPSQKITSLFFDEKSHCLFLGYIDGKVEPLMGSSSFTD